MWNAALKVTALVKVHAQWRAHVLVGWDSLEMIVGLVMNFIEGGTVRFCVHVRNKCGKHIINELRCPDAGINHTSNYV